MVSAGYSILRRRHDGVEVGPWQLVVSVPAALQAKVGSKQVWKSLRTGDRRQADRVAMDELQKLYVKWEGAPAPRGAAKDLAALAVDRGFQPMLDRLESHRREQLDDDAHAAVVAKRKADLLKMTRRRRDGIDDDWRALADRIIAKEGLAIETSDPEYQTFVELLADATLDAMAVFDRRNAGDLEAEPTSKTVRAVRSRQASTAAPGETILDLFDAYAAQTLAEGGKRPDVLAQDRKVIDQFAEFVGRDRAIGSITSADVREYRNTLRQLPTRWRERSELKGLSMRAAAEKASRAGLPGLALTTINKHLSTISPLFAWLIREEHDVTNPCTGLFHHRVKGKNPRPPFTTEQLNTILQSPLFTGFEAVGREHVAGENRADDWRYWIPLACLFSGARIGEIAQLRIGDVRRDDEGLPFALIAHDPTAGLATKSGNSRVMALHPKLVEIGFLVFVGRQMKRAGGDEAAALFPELTANVRGQIGATPSRFWRDYLSRIDVKGERDGFGAHSFRHLMADQLRLADYLDDEIEVALGHNQKTVTGGYGGVKQGTVRRLAEMIGKVQFKGVSFDHLIIEEASYPAENTRFARSVRPPPGMRFSGPQSDR